MKKLLVGLLIGLSAVCVGCSQSVEDVNKQAQQSVEILEQEKINEIRTRLIEECDLVNHDTSHCYSVNFRIDTVNDEIRYVVITPDEFYKFYTKSEMENVHAGFYKLVKNELKYEGAVYTDFAYYDEFTGNYNVYGAFTYATNGDPVQLHYDENYTKHGFLKYYNN